MYGQPKETCINAARMHIFEAKYKPKVRSAPLDHIKGVDAEMLPPYKNTLHHKFLRCYYVAFMWKHAQGQLPDIDLLNGEYSMKWFNCSQIPRSLESEVDEEAINIDVEVEDTMETEDDDSDQYFRSFLSIK